MTIVRITRIVCPICRGERVRLGATCFFCHGVAKVPVDCALDAAERRYRLAKGGVTSGDYPADVSRRLMDEANQIFDIAGVTPPWKQGAAA
ncbi:hypothetical protein J2Y48_003114 [Mycoplana sp. BE70]|uniref:hypothetical protein n=1 Tax=Mycoplana sp. BE70 TaxID=2817775 RepID=UPI0028578DA5|nr:hypothetical protein [Mycoplana sp. BE70]MDR6757817.1 hypothetical protein [Mycoplana sp. BE70]